MSLTGSSDMLMDIFQLENIPTHLMHTYVNTPSLHTAVHMPVLHADSLVMCLHINGAALICQSHLFQVCCFSNALYNCMYYSIDKCAYFNVKQNFCSNNNLYSKRGWTYHWESTVSIIIPVYRKPFFHTYRNVYESIENFQVDPKCGVVS